LSEGCPIRVGTRLDPETSADGFRPIPLDNALPSPVAIVDVRPLIEVLAHAAEPLASFPSAAHPAFLLDANRMGLGRQVRPGLFDNRAICRGSDFPSVERFHQAGIGRVRRLRRAD
jgi:hypothetical protein